MPTATRHRALFTAILLGLTLAFALGGTASAHVIVGTHGLTGDWGTYDFVLTPEGRCGYSAPDGSGTAYLRWMKVTAPIIIARDVTPARDHQTARWQFKLQRSHNGGAWRNVASSAVQNKITYDDTTSTLTPLKVFFKGHAGDKFRAMVTASWVRNGSVEGWVRFRVEFYSVKWTVGDPSYVYTDACDGAAN
jgi:hypothetical protein